tara:strand:+ start:221 stop:478 length:258 start_codon:yes stop_codon:yes gene_type:complete
MSHTKSELVFLKSKLSGDTNAQARENIVRLGLPDISNQTAELWCNLYIPILDQNRLYADHVTSGAMSMVEVIRNIRSRMKGNENE